MRWVAAVRAGVGRADGKGTPWLTVPHRAHRGELSLGYRLAKCSALNWWYTKERNCGRGSRWQLTDSSSGAALAAGGVGREV